MKRIYITILSLFAAAISSMAADTVTLAWDPSPGTNIIVNYNIYYGVAHQTYTNIAAAGNNLTLSVTNLIAGNTYFFAATAVDKDGLESEFSTEVSTFVSFPPVPPTPPQNLRILTVH